MSFPADPASIPALKSAIEAAASFALVPTVVQENYEEFRERSHGEGVRERSGKPLELWTDAQRVPVTKRKRGRDDEVVKSKVTNRTSAPSSGSRPVR